MRFEVAEAADGRDVPPELTGKTHRLGDAPSVLLVLLLLDDAACEEPLLDCAATAGAIAGQLQDGPPATAAIIQQSF